MNRPSIAFADALASSSMPKMREAMNSPRCPAVIGRPIKPPISRSRSFRAASSPASFVRALSTPPACRRSGRSGGAPVDQATERVGVGPGSSLQRLSQGRPADRVVHREPNEWRAGADGCLRVLDGVVQGSLLPPRLFGFAAKRPGGASGPWTSCASRADSCTSTGTWWTCTGCSRSSLRRHPIRLRCRRGRLASARPRSRSSTSRGDRLPRADALSRSYCPTADAVGDASRRHERDGPMPDTVRPPTTAVCGSPQACGGPVAVRSTTGPGPGVLRGDSRPCGGAHPSGGRCTGAAPSQDVGDRPVRTSEPSPTRLAASDARRRAGLGRG